ncbi:DUF3089 domain-containing protein [Nocardia vulneris]|uniref:DUF3089 domain-containing protein n=1 Tax=Nocardia vulneris TaxID=1141657 RepID=UPI0030CB1B54
MDTRSMSFGRSRKPSVGGINTDHRDHARLADPPQAKPRPAARVFRAAAVIGLSMVTMAMVVVHAEAEAEDDPVEWLCHPQVAPNPCAGSLKTTVRQPGSADIVAQPVDNPHKADCFYVYPTASLELATSASRQVRPELTAIAEQEASRFSQVCDVYAPVYRQRTVVAAAAESLSSVPEREQAYVMAYQDVLQAWRAYLGEHRTGRGVVLIGHSQGARMLCQLIRDEIETDPVANAAVISAVILGGNVVVPENADVGGDFRALPLCRARDQVHCVLAWSTFAETPPAQSRFGSASAATKPDQHGEPYGPGFEIACTNPVSLAENYDGETTMLVRTQPSTDAWDLGTGTVTGGQMPSASTSWLQPAERYRAQCRRLGDAHVLLVTPTPGSPSLPPFPTASWGLHLLDVTIALGDLLDITATQIDHYHASGR